MTLTQTEIEELRICIAEEMRWKKEYTFTSQTLGSRGEEIQAWISPSEETSVCKLPPYTTSLDAIQAACLERFKTGPETEKFSRYLEDRQTGESNQWQLTALDWCIAFARTAKIWRCKV